MASTFSIAVAPVQIPTLQTEGCKMQMVTVTYLAASTYATNGDTFTAAQLGLAAIDRVIAVPRAASLAATTTFVPAVNGATAPASIKLMLFSSNGAAPAPLVEVAATTAVAGQIVDLLVFGS